MRTVYVDVGGTNIRSFTIDGLRFTKRQSKIVNRKFILGLRGVWTAAEKKRWKKKLAHLAPNIDVISDIELAHRRAFGQKSGIVLNAGTGSIAFGRYKGKTARAGGVGPLLGDEGSAFWLGRQYLQQAKGNDWKFLRTIAVNKNPVKKIASFAPRGLQNKQLFEQAQQNLLKLVESVVRQLKAKEKLPLVLQGGVFSNRRFRDSFMRRARRFA